MRKTVIFATMTGAMLLGLATAAFAATGEYDDMCTMGLALGKEIKTDCSINAVDRRQDLLLRQRGSQDDLHEGSEGKSRQGAGILFKQEIADSALPSWRSAMTVRPSRDWRGLHLGDEPLQRIAGRGVGAAVDALGAEVALKRLDHLLQSSAVGAGELDAIAEGGKVLLQR